MKKKRAGIRTPSVGRKKLLFMAMCVPLVLAVAVIVYNQLKSSLFFQKKDRINIVFYGKNTVYYSLGKYDNVHYFISFYPDVKVKVPGSYGNYRVGGLGKLAYLEKNNDLYRKTFSVTTASTVDRYFFGKTQDIYYGKDEVGEDALDFPSAGDIFFMPSNSNAFDRLFLYLQFVGKRKSQFGKIDYKSSLGVDEEFFQDKDFAKKYQGFLYNRIYRKEQKSVQVYYRSSYKTAFFISKVIEGDGIRVSDLSEKPLALSGVKCEIIEEGTVFSQSAKDLSAFFGCRLTRGSTESSDIIMKLGSAEKEWEIL